MNTEQTMKNWNETKSKIKDRFGKLTDDSIESAKSNLDLLVGKIQSAYGYGKDQAEKELKTFRAGLAQVADVVAATVAPTPVVAEVAKPLAVASVTPIEPAKKTA